MAISPDGSQVATGGEDGAIVIHTRSGDLLRTIYPKYSQILCLEFSPTGNRLAAGLMSGEVALWDTVSGKKTARSVLRQTRLRIGLPSR